ncbi:hypothetical protein F511_41352 [Dorcoceras hygrometricum]|uniref:Uncharacterized protein n=1 Tax=Dorcoceras hygrometricum TaxID=472368 RepID=A0A2Z7DAQ2_9LAMI|nr:hypothetical protein F511_41352 [Dorcoceras hygrometricum]
MVAATSFFNRYDDVIKAVSRFISISNADVVVAARSFLQLTSSLLKPALALLIPDLYCSSSSSTFLPADFIDSVPDHIFA